MGWGSTLHGARINKIGMHREGAPPHSPPTMGNPEESGRFLEENHAHLFTEKVLFSKYRQ